MVMGRNIIKIIYLRKKNLDYALASVAQLVGVSSVGHKAVGSISSQSTYPGCTFHPQSEYLQEGNQLMFLSHTDVSLSL